MAVGTVVAGWLPPPTHAHAYAPPHARIHQPRTASWKDGGSRSRLGDESAAVSRSAFAGVASCNSQTASPGTPLDGCENEKTTRLDRRGDRHRRVRHSAARYSLASGGGAERALHCPILRGEAHGGSLNRQAIQASQSRIGRSFTREGVRFVVGKRKGRFETFQETMFSGGVTYIRLRPVKLIQQVPESQ